MSLHFSEWQERSVDFRKDNQANNDWRDLYSGRDKSMVLGLTISNNLLWNNHNIETIKKPNKWCYFLVLQKRQVLHYKI